MLSLKHPVSAVRNMAVEYVKEILAAGQVCSALMLRGCCVTACRKCSERPCTSLCEHLYLWNCKYCNLYGLCVSSIRRALMRHS